LKRITIVFATLLIMVNPAFADGLSAAPTDAEPAVIEEGVAGSDWAGAYGGVSYSRFSGDAFDGVAVAQYQSETVPGAFVGYNLQRGRVVFGGELSYSNTSMMIIADGDDFLNPVLDLRGRLGYSFGRTLVYGFAGYSRANMTVNGAVDDATVTGANYGVGIDLTVGKKLFVGLDYSIRNMSGTATTGGGVGTFDIDTDVKNLGLRVGLNF
jgi:outer membrane immunogenic protein